MGTWNNRVVIDPEYNLVAIHEVYYDEDENIVNWTHDSIAAADTLEELKSIFEILIQDIDKCIAGEVPPLYYYEDIIVETLPVVQEVVPVVKEENYAL